MSRKSRLLLLLGLLLLVGCGIRRDRGNDFERIIWTVDWSADGRLAIGGNQGSLRVYRQEPSGRPGTWPVSGTITAVAWHPTRDLLAVTVQGSGSPSFLVKAGQQSTFPLDSVSPDGARGIGWNAAGDRLAVSDNDGFLLLYDASGALQSRRRVDPKGTTALAWHPDGRRIDVVGSAWHTYFPAADSLVSRPFRAESTLVLTADWNPTGELLALGDYGDRDSAIPPELQFRTPRDSLELRYAGGSAEYRSVRWDSEGALLAAGADGVYLWDVEGTLVAHVLRDHYIWGISWHPDGSRLMATSGEGQAFLLDRNLNILRTYNRP